MVAAQFSAYPNSCNLGEQIHSAYRTFHSTETALLQVFNDILCAIYQRQCVILILLNLAAAFDTIYYNIMVVRLRERFSINGTALDWLTSYPVFLLTEHPIKPCCPSLWSTSMILDGTPVVHSLYITPRRDNSQTLCQSAFIFTDKWYMMTRSWHCIVCKIASLKFKNGCLIISSNSAQTRLSCLS